MIATLLALSLALAEPPAPLGIEIGELRLVPLAQLRVRGEVLPDRALADATSPPALTHRARVGARASLAAFDLVVRVQDVRAWGSERVPEGLPPDPTVYGVAPDSLGLHEAFVGIHLGEIEARVGRQEIVIGNERLIGNLDWLQRGRAFDAIRLLKDGDTSWSVFGALISTGDATDRVLAGANVEMKLASWSKLSPIIVYDGRFGVDTHLTTIGARVDGAAGGFGYDVELYAQSTRAPDAGINVATLAGARASYAFDTVLHPKIGVLTDAVSGSADPRKGGLAPFDTLFATNHKFYGFADLFTALPLHTQGRGLVDSAAALWLREGPWSAASYLHVFMPFAYEGADVPIYGVEPDLVGAFQATDNLSLELGCALFVPTGTALGRGTSSAAWAYAQITAQL